MSKKTTNKSLISKNIRTLRTRLGLTLVDFGSQFSLSKENIASYEGGVAMKTEKFLEIMNHFSLSPFLFAKFDMELVDVSIEKDEKFIANTNIKLGMSGLVPEKDENELIPTEVRYKYIEEASHKSLVRMCKILLHFKEETIRKTSKEKDLAYQMQDKVIFFQEEINKLQKKIIELQQLGV